MPAAEAVCVFDPEGATSGMLRKLGVTFKELRALTDVASAKYLILGKFSLSGSELGFNQEDVAKGLRVLIMPQRAAEWKELGFDVHDPLARQVFLRGKRNPALAPLTDDVPRNWRGVPGYGSTWGGLAPHAAFLRDFLGDAQDNTLTVHASGTNAGRIVKLARFATADSPAMFAPSP